MIIHRTTVYALIYVMQYTKELVKVSTSSIGIFQLYLNLNIQIGTGKKIITGVGNTLSHHGLHSLNINEYKFSIIVIKYNMKTAQKEHCRLKFVS